MEELFKIIKTFILETVNPVLTEKATTSTPLTLFTDKSIVFGQIDLATMQNKVVCSVFPESQEDEDGDISSSATSSTFTITFVCRNALYDVLVRQMCRYAEIFRECVITDYTLDSDTVENAEIGTRTFYPDAGNDVKQITAVEVKLTLTTTEEIGE